MTAMTIGKVLCCRLVSENEARLPRAYTAAAVSSWSIVHTCVLVKGGTRGVGCSERLHDDGVVVGCHGNVCTLLRHLPTTGHTTDRTIQASQKGVCIERI